MADALELWEQLLEPSWKGMTFPITSFDFTLRHDLVQHKYVRRPGANIEDTDLAPMQFGARIPFRNGVVPGRFETWGILYPDAYRAFIKLCTETTNGALIHPEFGAITCKVEHVHTVWQAEPRDGVDVEVSWLQTIDPLGAALNPSPSPMASVALTALDLDATMQQILPAPPTLPQYTPDFAALMNSITGAVDTVSMLERNAAGRIDQVSYRMDQLRNSLATVFTDNGQPTSLAWPIRQSIERMKSTLNDLRQALGTGPKSVGIYVTPADDTLASIASYLNVGITDTIRLNARLMGAPVIAAGSNVYYYKPNQ